MYAYYGLLGIGIVLLGFYANTGPGNVTTVISKLDGKSYQVQNLPDKQEAAERMAEIRGLLEKILNEYRQPEYKQDQPAQLLLKRLHLENMMENDINSLHTSYAENKGERVVICLRDKTKKPYPLEDKNTVIFVVLHEMAHLMTESTGHTQEFWSNFKRLLQDATKLGVYKEVNYSKNPVDYCGMQITDSPL